MDPRVKPEDDEIHVPEGDMRFKPIQALLALQRARNLSTASIFGP